MREEIAHKEMQEELARRARGQSSPDPTKKDEPDVGSQSTGGQQPDPTRKSEPDVQEAREVADRVQPTVD